VRFEPLVSVSRAKVNWLAGGVFTGSDYLGESGPVSGVSGVHGRAWAGVWRQACVVVCLPVGCA
jgi:hypothetical protein